MKKRSKFMLLGLIGLLWALCFTACGDTPSGGENTPQEASYSITIKSGITNGSVTLDKQNAAAGETVTLSIAPNFGYELSSITVKGADNFDVALTGSGNTRTFKMPAQNVTVNATFTVIVYRIIIPTDITHGSITADKTTANAGETVTLTITSDEHYVLSSLAVKGVDNSIVSISGSGNKRTFIMPSQNVEIRASFDQIINSTVNKSNGIVNGDITVEKSTAYTGDTVGISVSPNEGYELDAVIVTVADGSTVNVNISENDITFIMPAQAVTVSATFKAIEYTVYIMSGIEFGTISVTPTTAAVGESVIITASPEAGYELRSISVCGEKNVNISISGDGNTRTFIMPAQNVYVYATFRKLPRNAITISNTIENGTVSSVKTETYRGDTVVLTANPATGYKLGSFTVTGSDSTEITVSIENNKGTFTMPAQPVTVSAAFTPIDYNVTVSTSIINGSVTANKSIANIGNEVSLTIRPSEGYSLASITVTKSDGTNFEVGGTGETRTFTMPANNVTIYATFDAPTSTAYNVLPAGTNGTLGSAATYVLFGDFPQTIKAENVTVEETWPVTKGMYDYYRGSDGGWYVKLKEDSYDSKKYSDGTESKQSYQNSYRYFKVEPIKWCIVTSDFDNDNKEATKGKKLLLAENILTTSLYYDNESKRTINGEDVYAHNYMYSRIRAYLNGYNYIKDSTENSELYENGFLYTAFTANLQDCIATTIVDNSENSITQTGYATSPTPDLCGNTEDKVFLMSVNEMTSYGFAGKNDSDDKRKHPVTDFSIANYVNATTESDYASWWLRSPSGEPRNGNVNSVDKQGNLKIQYANKWGIYGVVPALCLE